MIQVFSDSKDLARGAAEYFVARSSEAVAPDHPDSNSEKAGIVKEVLEGPKKYPAQFVQPTNGQLLWMLDKEAAG